MEDHGSSSNRSDSAAKSSVEGSALDLGALEKIARAVPSHLIHTGWQRTKNPVFGEWQVYADDGRGMGRQHIANTPANKGYGFTDLSEFIAAFDPPTVLRLIHRVALAHEVIPTLSAQVVAAESGRLRLLEALERSAEGWANAIELGLIPKQHVGSATILRDEGRAAIAKATREPT